MIHPQNGGQVHQKDGGQVGKTISKYKILEKIRQKDGGQVGEGGNLSRYKLIKRTY